MRYCELTCAQALKATEKCTRLNPARRVARVQGVYNNDCPPKQSMRGDLLEISRNVEAVLFLFSNTDTDAVRKAASEFAIQSDKQS